MSRALGVDDFVEELVSICRIFAAFEKEQVCCGTVTVPQCVALQHLLDDGASDVSALAESLNTSISATTRLVDGMEKRGWVARERDPEDRRRVFVGLTDGGRDEAERLKGLSRQAAIEVLGRVPVSRQHDVIEAMGLVRQALEQVQDDGVDL